MSFKDIDQQQHNYFAEINQLLQQYDDSKPPSVQSRLFEKILVLHEKLQVLQKQHITLTKKLINNSYKSQTTPKGFYYFINKILDHSNIDEQTYLTALSFTLQIMSRPIGRYLINKINQLHRKQKETRIILTHGENFQVTPSNTEICITLPKTILKPNLRLVPGLHEESIMSLQPDFIAFAHELIHTLNHMLKQNQNPLWEYIGSLLRINHLYNKKPSPTFVSPTKAIYYLYSDLSALRTMHNEEKLTIEDNPICENSIRSEHNLPLRGGHHAITIKTATEISKKFSLIRFFVTLRMGKVNFKNIYIDSSHQLPTLLNTENLKGVTLCKRSRINACL